MRTYEKFEGHDLEIAEKILQRRLQLLVHSRIYYKMSNNIISDFTWDKWARELLALQKEYPYISCEVEWYDAFHDWDASTGAFLPLDDEWVVNKAHKLLGVWKDSEPKKKKSEAKPEVKKSTNLHRALF